MDRKDRYGHETGGEARTVALILAATAAAVGISLLCGCSHNPAQFVFGEQTRLGFGDYGTFSTVEGIVVNDIPRENTEFSIEIDAEKGVEYDPASGTLKGVKKITRKVGPQITGYLVDLAKVSPEAAVEYLKSIGAKEDAE